MKTLLTLYSNRWQQLPSRDRLALRLLTLFLAAALFWGLLWNPQREALRHAEQHLKEALQLQTDLLTLSVSSNKGSTQVNSKTLAGLIAETTANANLTVERMGSEESGRLNLTLGGSLGDLLKWVESVESQDVTLVSLQLEVTPQAIAQARLTLESR